MKKHLQHFLSIVVAVFLCMNAFSQDTPDTLSTSYGDGADTYVCNDEKIGPDEVGSDQYLVVRNHEVRMRITFLRFDITDNPRFNPADQAYIGLYVNHAEKMGDPSREISVYGMTDDALDNWDETLLTYYTAPGLNFADLANYSLRKSKTRYLTKLTIPADTLGWVYSEPTAEMDEFINDVNENHMLTFILLVEEPNTGDEVRFDSKEDTDTLRAPILHSMEPIGIVENKSLSGVSMKQNFPNPFNGITTLSYHLKEAGHVELTMYNVLGAKVATLVNEFQGTGVHNVNVHVGGLKLSPGIYYTKINVGSFSQTIKMICE
ncbi:MAG: T9SS type A sorting domain-containing protein [Bacteroidales bacterium]